MQPRSPLRRWARSHHTSGGARNALRLGIDTDALTYVFSANQHRRELARSRRAAVAATLVLRISEQVAERRPERIRQAWEGRRAAGCLALMPPNLEDGNGPVSSRAGRRPSECR